jgi:hypothetical protein
MRCLFFPLGLVRKPCPKPAVFRHNFIEGKDYTMTEVLAGLYKDKPLAHLLPHPSVEQATFFDIREIAPADFKSGIFRDCSQALLIYFLGTGERKAGVRGK